MTPQTALRNAVRDAYSHVAESPHAEHPFKVGRAFAEGLGYPAEWLDRVPATSLAAFTGVSCVPNFAELPDGARVLDLGCGAGTDALIAAMRVGEKGTVTGFDFSEPMLARARASAREAGLRNAAFQSGDAECIPLDDAAVDVALVNGIFNLNPARDQIMRELARVLKPGGALFCAETVLREPLTDEERNNLSNWFS
jgi:SAM-dependent methyltransferase